MQNLEASSESLRTVKKLNILLCTCFASAKTCTLVSVFVFIYVLLNKAVVFFLAVKPHERRLRFPCQESSLQTYPCGEFCSFFNKTSPVNMHKFTNVR